MKSPFKMIHHRLLAVTGLLILLLYSGYALYTSLVVFTITVITTYICYTLNTQLRFDGFFKFLIYFGIGKYFWCIPSHHRIIFVRLLSFFYLVPRKSSMQRKEKTSILHN